MDWKEKTDRVATTFTEFITAWLLFVGLSEKQSVCNKTKKFIGTSSKDYWRSCTHCSRIPQKCYIQFLWSNSSLSNSKWCTIRAFNTITLTGRTTDRSCFDWPDYRPISPWLAASQTDFAFTSRITNRSCLDWSDHRPISPSLAALFSNLSPSTKDVLIRLGNLLNYFFDHKSLKILKNSFWDDF